MCWFAVELDKTTLNQKTLGVSPLRRNPSTTAYNGNNKM